MAWRGALLAKHPNTAVIPVMEKNLDRITVVVALIFVGLPFVVRTVEGRVRFHDGKLGRKYVSVDMPAMAAE